MSLATISILFPSYLASVISVNTLFLDLSPHLFSKKQRKLKGETHGF